jgi:hypothetical protein
MLVNYGTACNAACNKALRKKKKKKKNADGVVVVVVRLNCTPPPYQARSLPLLFETPFILRLLFMKARVGRASI